MAGGTQEHVPVLAEAVVEWLAVRPEGVYVDATAGAGGHASLIAAQLRGGRLIAFDRDPFAVALAGRRLADFACAEVHYGNYGRLAEGLSALGITAVDGVLIDAGVSSMQLDTPARGFTFQEDGPLDMRMDTSSGPTAEEYLAGVREAELAEALRQYGDIGPARRIAKEIVRRRDGGRMHRTRDLVEAVHDALGISREVPEETRPVFQAIRIAVNEELRWLEQGLTQGAAALNPGGRLAVITFHSGEDRVAKNVFRDAARPKREYHPDGRTASVREPYLKILTPKPVLPDARECRHNPRSKSAKLRVAERI